MWGYTFNADVPNCLVVLGGDSCPKIMNSNLSTFP